MKSVSSRPTLVCCRCRLAKHHTQLLPGDSCVRCTGKSQPRAGEGIIDVSLPPFSADKSGQRDSTVAIQAAVDYARENYQIVRHPI